jgi:hypothetical protein
MMDLRDIFEFTLASLLHLSFIPSLVVVVKEFIFEDNRCPIHHMPSAEVNLATPPTTSRNTSNRPTSLSSSQLASKTLYCNYCWHNDYIMYDCRKKENSGTNFKPFHTKKLLSTPLIPLIMSLLLIFLWLFHSLLLMLRPSSISICFSIPQSFYHFR